MCGCSDDGGSTDGQAAGESASDGHSGDGAAVGDGDGDGDVVGDGDGDVPGDGDGDIPGDGDGDIPGDGDGDGDGDGGGMPTEFEPSDADFAGCITDGIKVNRMYVRNLIGNDEDSAAVARGDTPTPYPVGTMIQLRPAQAMVKRLPGFSVATGDWEYFNLIPSTAGASINERGTTAISDTSGTCNSCHSLASDDDYVCQQTLKCSSTLFPVAGIEQAQAADPRCTQ